MKKGLLFILILIVLVLAIQIPVFATDFITEGLTQSEQIRIGNNLVFSKYNSKKVAFGNFDVNEQGMIALASDFDTAKPTVYVYNTEGKFQYKYTVDTAGEIYTEWDGDNLWIYLTKSSFAVLVDDNGSVLKAEKLLDTYQNASHWSEVRAKKKTVGDKTYTAKTGLSVLGIFANGYAQIIETDANGNESTLYNVRSSLLKKAILGLLLVSALVFLSISVIILAAKGASRYQNRQQYGTPYAPHHKRDFYDRIYDILEKSSKKQDAPDDSDDLL